MPGIGIIVNPHSRGHRRDPNKVERLGFIVGDKGSCHATKDVLDIGKLAREFKDRGIDILGISGGDGTNHVTLTEFVKIYGTDPLPKIAFLRGGTMNNLANSLNIKGAPERILSNLILKYHEDIPFEETEIDLLRINDEYGFLFGMGLVSRFVERYNTHSNGDPTPWYGFKMLSRAMLSSLCNGKMAQEFCRRFDANIIADGRPSPFKNYMMIFAGTMETLGFHFRPLYRAREKAGKFQFVGISTTPRQLLFTFPQAFLGKPSGSDDYFDTTASNLTIELNEPHSYTIDGDTPEAADKIELSTGPRLKVIVS